MEKKELHEPRLAIGPEYLFDPIEAQRSLIDEPRGSLAAMLFGELLICLLNMSFGICDTELFSKHRKKMDLPDND